MQPFAATGVLVLRKRQTGRLVHPRRQNNHDSETNSPRRADLRGLGPSGLEQFWNSRSGRIHPDDLDSGVRSVAGVFALVEQNYADPVFRRPRFL